MFLRTLFSLVLFCLFAPVSLAQDQYWNAISLNKTIAGIDYNLDSEQRMEGFLEDQRMLNFSLGAGTDIGENNSIGLELRRESKPGSGGWQWENRYSLLLGDSRSFGDYKLATRFKLESRDKPSSYELRSRLRFKLSTSMESWSPWASVEVFYDNSDSFFSENRYSLGADYQLTQTLKVSGYYLFRRTTGGGSWDNSNILGTKFSYQF